MASIGYGEGPALPQEAQDVCPHHLVIISPSLLPTHLTPSLSHIPLKILPKLQDQANPGTAPPKELDAISVGSSDLVKLQGLRSSVTILSSPLCTALEPYA